MSEVQERLAANVVTSENLQDFQLKRMGIEIPSFADQKAEIEDAEIIEEKEIAAEEEEEDHEEEEVKKEEEKPKKQGKFAKRLSELTQQRNQEREARTALEARLAALEAGKPKEQPAQQQAQPDESVMPDPARYTSQEEYNRDYQTWQRTEIQKEAQKIIQAERNQTQQQQVLTKWNTRVAEFTAETPDFNDKMADVRHLAPALERNGVLPMLANSDYGVEVMYHYMNNPAEAEKLAKMHPIDAAIQVGRLEARFESKKEVKETAIQAVKSKAPAPINPIRGGKSASDPIGSDGEFTGTPAEWKALRKAGKIK